jgi:type IV pilus assembly protein PilM
MIVCGECDNPNVAEQRFCGKCGARLWQPCANCGEKNPIDLAFCGSCGVNLREQLDRAILAIDEKIEMARQLCSSGQYHQALPLLQSVSANGDSRIEPYEQMARTLHERFTAERLVKLADAERLARRAQDLASAADYASAKAAMAEIPQGLRTSEMVDLMARIDDRLNEIQALTAGVQEAMESRQYEGLLSKVDRLLELQPHSPRLRALAEGLRSRQDQVNAERVKQILAEAKKLLAKRQYESAAECLAKIDETALDAELQPIYARCSEVCWLWRQIRISPYVTPALVAIADRFCRVCPNDPGAQSLRARVEQRKRSPTCDPGLPCVHTWTKPRPSSIAGCPVVPWVGSFNSETIDFHGQADWPRFIAAYGLALQGLDLSIIKADLNLKQQTSLIQLLSNPIGRASLPKEAWGVDVGNSGVKAVWLTREDAAEPPAISRCVFVPHSPPLHTVTDEPSRRQIMRSTVSRLCNEAEIERGSAVVGLAGLRTIGRFFDIPKMKAKKLGDAIAYEARVQIPIPLDQIAYDYHVWQGEHPRLQAVTIFAARRDHVKQTLDLFADSSFKVVTVQSTFVALFNAVCHEFLDLAESARSIGVLDVGSESSVLIAGNRLRLRYRSLSFGTERLIQTLAERFKLPRSKSEQFLTNPQSAPWMHQVDRELSRAYQDLAGEVQRSLESFRNDGIDADRIVVSGGGALVHSLIRYLTCAE